MAGRVRFTARDMAAGFVQGLMTAGLNNDMYVPHSKQVSFHISESQKKQYVGGNRSGKTVGGVNEDIWWLKKEHPYRHLPIAPSQITEGRVVTTDFDDGLQKIILPKFSQWMPPSLLLNGSWEDSYNKQGKILTCSNGSICDFMTYKQKTEDFAGVGRHFTHFDEEPPKDIFEECLARLIDYNGSWWMTMTPVEGMTWTFDEIYNNADILTIEVDMEDNPHISQEAIQNYLMGLDEQTRRMRKSGVYVAQTGLIFPKFDPSIHVIPSISLDNRFAAWKLYLSLDSGINHPTAVHWHLVSPVGVVITFAEHHRADWTVKQHADRILEKIALMGRRPDVQTCDPALRQRQLVTGVSVQLEYRKHGLVLSPPVKNDFDAGIMRMKQYIFHDKNTKPRWYITEDCPRLIWEMRRYRWEPWENKKLQQKKAPKQRPLKKDDDCIDDCRYFFSFLPNLEPAMRMQELDLPVASLVGARKNTMLTSASGIRRIATEPRIRKTEWTEVLDEHLGGEY